MSKKVEKENQQTSRVFVYGSLKEGFHNHSVLTRCGGKKVGDAKLEGTGFTFVDLGAYPGVVLTTEGKGTSPVIHGEVYEVTESGLRSCDILEGHPNYYQRFKVQTSLDKAARTWCYFLPPGKGYEKAPAVKDGRWSR